MASRTIARLYDSYADASSVVRDLEAAGFSHDDVSLIANRTDGDGTASTTEAEGETGAGTGAGTGATLGTLVGGGAGLLAGIGALAIPGIGPIVAAGWLVAALTGAGVGAAAGGLLGGLTQAGIGEEHAQVYAEGVKRGGNLVTVRTDDSRAAEAEAIMGRHNAVDTEARAVSYRSGGWKGFQETSGSGIASGAAAGAATAASGFGSASASTPDGAPGNPPGTMASRALDAVTGTNVSGTHSETASRHLGGSAAVGGTGIGGSLGTGGMGTGGMTSSAPDGAPGNPPGTMASRAVDQTVGTNLSGAHPENEASRHLGGSASVGGTGTGGMTSSAPDGAPGNPPGTMASRAVDEVAGTNISGAHPENADGTPNNPAGTAAGRTADRNLGTSTTPPGRGPAR